MTIKCLATNKYRSAKTVFSIFIMSIFLKVGTIIAIMSLMCCYTVFLQWKLLLCM